MGYDSNDEEHKSFIEKIITLTNVNFLAGLVTGVTTTAAFNPWDRAIYLSVKNKSTFLSELRTGNPYQGFSQAVVQRTFSGMLYFAFAGQIRTEVEKYPITQHLSPGVKNFIIGTNAGILNGLILNQLSVIKYYTWGKENRYFLRSARDVYRKGGMRALFKGVNATITRDIVFGICYEVGRHKLHNRFQFTASSQKNEVICNLTCAALATVASGPFNFARNIKYGTPLREKPPSTFHCVYRLLFLKAFQSPNPLLFLQARMRVGWGTARVAVGMASAQYLFDNIKSYIEKHYQ